MTVKVLFFASCRDLIGERERRVILPEGATVRDLIAEVSSEHASFAAMAPSLMVSVNQDYVDRVAVLKEGDEVAFIPPVSGG